MIVSRWTRVEVRALRTAALRLTQEEFAERTGYQLPTIRKWHRKTWDRPVRGRSAEVLDTILSGLDGDQLARFEAEIAAETGSNRHGGEEGTQWPSGGFGLYEWEVDGDMRRREFARVATVAGVAVTTGAWEFGERIGQADVRRLRAGVDHLGAQDQQLGGGTLVRLAVEQLARAKHGLDTATYETASGTAFAAATGNLAVLTGWLAYDSGLHPLACRCYADALALGTEADDKDLIVHVCLTAANQPLTLARIGAGSPYYALQLVDRARTLMHGRPPGRIHALIAVREAQARGLLGDRAGFGRAIATAWRELDHALDYEPIEECPQWLRFVNHSEIRGHEARGWGDIGEWQRTATLLDTAIREESAPRNAACLRAGAAAAQARLGDIRTALDMGLAVLDDLETIASARPLRALAPVRSRADDASGAEFRHRFDTLSANLEQKAITV